MFGKKFKKSFSMLLVTLVSASMIGCGASSKGGSSSSSEPTTLNIYVFGEWKNTDKVVKKFEEQTKDTLNIKLNIKQNTAADHKEKVPLMISTGEDVDLVFDAYWMNLGSMISQGAYADLSSYFNNDKYPGFKKAFSKDYIDSNAIDGKTYAVPFSTSYEDLPGVFIRKDLREKYGIGEIKSVDDLENFFKVIKEKEPNLVAPFAIGGSRGFYKLGADVYEKRNAGIVALTGTGVDLEAYIKDNKVVDVTCTGDDTSAFANRPAPYNTDTIAKRMIEYYPKWSKYVEPNPHVENDGYNNLFKPGKTAATEGSLASFDKYSKELAQSVPGATLEFFPYIKDQYDMKEKAIVTMPQTANNFLSIPENSTKKEAAMKFLDWIFQNQDNHDLFELGIKGEDWEPVGDDGYKLLSPSNLYSIPTYELTSNSTYMRILDTIPAKEKAWMKYQSNLSTYVPSPITGFMFNTAPVKNEVAALSTVMNKYRKLFCNGILGDAPAETIKAYYDEAKAAGLETVRAEAKKQLEAHLAKKK